jgi:hypothetical protein
MAKKAPAPAKTKKQPAPKAAAAAAPDLDKKRRVKVPVYKSFRLEKKVKREIPQQIPSGWKLFKATLIMIFKTHWKVFVGIAAVYAFLNLMLVSGFSAVNLTDAKKSFSDVVGGEINQAATGLSLFVYLLGNSSTTASPSASVYQIILGIVVSLAVLWALRQIYAGNKPRIRDTFYQGMYPLVPVVLVLLVIGIEILPLAGGAYIYTMIVNNGIAATAVEQVMWLLLFLLLATATVYMLCSTLFALYIVSLPEMTPMAALRSARQLVLHRRWTVVRKILFLPVALIALSALILTPIIMFITPVAPWLFFAMSMFLLPIVHGYLYALYRSML